LAQHLGKPAGKLQRTLSGRRAGEHGYNRARSTFKSRSVGLRRAERKLLGKHGTSCQAKRYEIAFADRPHNLSCKRSASHRK
jgi:hypothetical protein